jgi:hypothetical protein
MVKQNSIKIIHFRFSSDPEYQTFVANMNASESLPNAETMLEEIEKKQLDIQGQTHLIKYELYFESL